MLMFCVLILGRAQEHYRRQMMQTILNTSSFSLNCVSGFFIACKNVTVAKTALLIIQIVY